MWNTLMYPMPMLAEVLKTKTKTKTGYLKQCRLLMSDTQTGYAPMRLTDYSQLPHVAVLHSHLIDIFISVNVFFSFYSCSSSMAADKLTNPFSFYFFPNRVNKDGFF